MNARPDRSQGRGGRENRWRRHRFAEKRILGLILLAGFGFTLRAAAPGPPPPAALAFDQRIGEALPLDTVFVDETGEARPLRAYFGSAPVVLTFDYFRCPQLCSVVEHGAVSALRHVTATIGRDVTVVTISIDPTDTPAMAAEKKEQAVARYGRAGAAAGWHVLTGGEAAIRAVAAAAGFHYSYDPRSRRYGHPAGLVVVTPKGIVSRYFFGVDYAAPEVAAALERAADNRTGVSVYNLLLLCLQGGGPAGRYGRLIWTVLSISVGLTVVAVFGGIGWALYRESKTRARAKEPS